GCNADTSTSVQGDISVADAQTISAALSAAMLSSFATPGALHISADGTVTFTQSCPGGGTVAGTGKLTQNVNAQGTGTVGYNLTVTPSSCVVKSATTSFTVNGSPNVTFDAGLNLQNMMTCGEMTSNPDGTV